jgi:hypothetical protein
MNTSELGTTVIAGLADVDADVDATAPGWFPQAPTAADAATRDRRPRPLAPPGAGVVTCDELSRALGPPVVDPVSPGRLADTPAGATAPN